MTTIIQQLTPDFPSDSGPVPTTVWKSDAQLAQPELVFPKDNANLCGESTDHKNKLTYGYSGVTLRWEAVTGANFYVVQWAYTPAFNGPSFRAAQVATNSKRLNFGTDIHMLHKTYWRVMAVSNLGAASVKSETWSFEIDCDLDSSEDVLCSALDVNLKLTGPDILRNGDSRLYVLDADWDRWSRETGALITRVRTDWGVNSNKVGFLCSDEGTAVVDVDDELSTSEIVELTATVVFDYTIPDNSDPGSEPQFEQTFVCEVKKEITLEAGLVYEGRKHGIIRQYYGKNMYKVELVDRVFGGDLNEYGSYESGSSSGDINAYDCAEPDGPYLMGWLEGLDDNPQFVTAADLELRLVNEIDNQGANDFVLKHLPEGTRVIIGRIQGRDYNEVISGGGDESEPCLNQDLYWWILVAAPSSARPVSVHVTGLVCATDCDNNAVIDVTTQKVIHVPGTIVCTAVNPPQRSCEPAEGGGEEGV